MSTIICSIIPDTYIKQYNVSQASCSFCRKLIDSNVFNFCYSFLPVTVNKKLKLNNEYNIRYIQIRIFPHIKSLRYINSIIETVIAFVHIIKNKENNIWFYNLDKQNLLLYYILKYLTNKKTYILLADFTPPTKKYSITNFIKYLIQTSNATITLSERNNLNLKNNITIPGIITRKPIKSVLQKEINKTSFLFSGFLGKVTGIDLALNFFSLHPELNLTITGRGKDEETIIKYTQKYTNIRYLGFLDNNTYMKVLNQHDICLNFRNPNLAENKNNFPSKLIEYIYSNKIVISTMKYPELKDIDYYSIDYNIQSILEAIQDIQTTDELDLLKKRSQSNKLYDICSPEKWRSSIKQLEK